MKHFLCALLIVIVSATAVHATDVGVSVSVAQPGFYGRVDVGNVPRPAVIYARPVVVHPAKSSEASSAKVRAAECATRLFMRRIIPTRERGARVPISRNRGSAGHLVRPQCQDLNTVLCDRDGVFELRR